MVHVVGDEGNVEEDDARVDWEVDTFPLREGGLLGPGGGGGSGEGGEREGCGGGLEDELAASRGGGAGGE